VLSRIREELNYLKLFLDVFRVDFNLKIV
jgi:hypothetical protein